jgi:hypothetical protein
MAMNLRLSDEDAARLKALAEAEGVSLHENGLDLDLDDDEAFDLTMSVAAGQLSADDIDERLRTRPAPR